jgi:hypothetical protein
LAALSKILPTAKAMLHIEPKFKVKEILMRIGELSMRKGVSTAHSLL